MARAIIYARYSPRKDAASSLSNETQIALCREYCAKHGHEEYLVFEDAAISGKASRVGLRAAIAALKRGDVLVAYASSRLARKVLVLELVYDQVANKKASVELVEDGGRVSTNPIDVCMRQVRAAFDEYDRKMIGKRTSDAMRRHMANGIAIGNDPPYGKQAGPVREIGGKMRRTVVDNPAEQEIIQLIMRLRERPMAMREITRYLNDSNVRARGREWNHVTVSRILARNKVCQKMPLATE